MIKVTLIGRVGSKPEQRATKAGRPVVNFNVAVSAGKDANGEYISKWYPITCWDGRAELAVKLLEKGDLVMIEGSPEVSSWQDKKGEDHIELAVHCKYLQLLARSNKRQGAEPEAEAEVSATAASAFDDLPF
jgi:single stranded DNA-binding protein